MSWYVAETAYRADRTAETLMLAGVEAWCPLYREKRRVRWTYRSRPRWTVSEQPVFPGYVFVGLDGADACAAFHREWRDVAVLLHDVEGGFRVRPPMPTGDVERIRALEVNGLLRFDEAMRQALKAGDVVRVIEGLLTGYTVRLLQDAPAACESDDLRLWAETFGPGARSRRVRLPMVHMARI